MKIVFDHQAFTMQRHGGVSRYFFELSARMTEMPGVEADISAPLYVASYFSRAGAPRPRGILVPDVARLAHARRFANDVISKMVNHRMRNVDIFHETYYTKSDTAPPASRRILTVYDMIHEKYPEHFSRSDRTRSIKLHAVDRADHVICISESTRRDLVSIAGIPIENTSVVHLGPGLVPGCVSAEEAPAGQRPYILYVGSRGGYKNFEALLGAFGSSPWLRAEVSLLCFGGGKFTSREQELITLAGLDTGHVTQLDGGDEVLAGLYSSASALVYPSLYEGFGIPPLEAMSFGCPVICSNTSSLPEVVGDAAELFDPAESGSILAAMENVLNSRERIQSLIALGFKRAEDFSWDRCAQETLAVYRRQLQLK